MKYFGWGPHLLNPPLATPLHSAPKQTQLKLFAFTFFGKHFIVTFTDILEKFRDCVKEFSLVRYWTFGMLPDVKQARFKESHNIPFSMPGFRNTTYVFKVVCVD